MNLFKNKRKAKLIAIGLFSYVLTVSTFVYFTTYYKAASRSIEDAKTTSDVVLVDFSAEGCPPCRKLDVLVDEFEDDYKPYLKVVRVDINSEDGLHKKYDIHIVPTVIFFYKGKMHSKLVGLHDKQVYIDQIENMLIMKVLDIYAIMIKENGN